MQTANCDDSGTDTLSGDQIMKTVTGKHCERLDAVHKEIQIQKYSAVRFNEAVDFAWSGMKHKTKSRLLNVITSKNEETKQQRFQSTRTIKIAPKNNDLYPTQRTLYELIVFLIMYVNTT